MYTYENNDNIENDIMQVFKVGHFFKNVDCAIFALDERFDEYTRFNDVFGFLNNIGNLKDKNNDDLKKHCDDLHLFLQD